MKSTNFKLLMLMALVAVLAACGQANLGGTLNNVNGSSNNSNGGNAVNPADPWAGVQTSATASNVFGTQGFQIDTINSLLKLTIALPANPLGASFRQDIPEIPGAYAEIAPDPNSGQWVLSFNIPLSYLVKGINLVGPKTLPNGDDLPGVPGGEPPRIAGHITRGNLDMYVYGSVKYFGVYFPTPKLDPRLNLTFPIYNKDKTVILGYFATVAAKNGFSGGLFISIVFPPQLAKVLDDLFG